MHPSTVVCSIKRVVETSCSVSKNNDNEWEAVRGSNVLCCGALNNDAIDLHQIRELQGLSSFQRTETLLKFL
jgi:hypothetical protein